METSDSIVGVVQFLPERLPACTSQPQGHLLQYKGILAAVEHGLFFEIKTINSNLMLLLVVSGY